MSKISRVAASSEHGVVVAECGGLEVASEHGMVMMVVSKEGLVVAAATRSNLRYPIASALGRWNESERSRCSRDNFLVIPDERPGSARKSNDINTKVTQEMDVSCITKSNYWLWPHSGVKNVFGWVSTFSSEKWVSKPN